MIDLGDEIILKATCIYTNGDGYRFSLKKNFSIYGSFDEEGALIIRLSETDPAYNQRIHEFLEQSRKPRGLTWFLAPLRRMLKRRLKGAKK
jgi:hypothetical protein